MYCLQMSAPIKLIVSQKRLANVSQQEKNSSVTLLKTYREMVNRSVSFHLKDKNSLSEFNQRQVMPEVEHLL